MMRTTMMNSNSLRRLAMVFLACCIVFSVWPRDVFAAGDEFGDIVHHIEARYHVHRNYSFILGFAGLVVKAWQGTGVKDVKVALFEDQNLLHSASDRELDELVQAAGRSGWRPMVKRFDRRSGEHTYIYARGDGRDGKDLRLLIVNVEPTEAEVVQLRLNPDRLEEFLDEHGGSKSHRSREMASN